VTLRWSGHHTLKIHSRGHEPWSTDFEYQDFWREGIEPQALKLLAVDDEARKVGSPSLGQMSDMIVGHDYTRQTHAYDDKEKKNKYGVFTVTLFQEPMCSPACGCRVYADSLTTVRSMPLCRNTCYAPPSYFQDLNSGKKSFMYFRFTVLKVRGDPSNPDVSKFQNTLQISEITFRGGGIDIDMAGVVATNPGGLHSPYPWYHEGPEMAIDGDTSTKWLDGSSLSSSLVLEFPRSTYADQFSFITANDHPARDPVSWRVEGSNDAASWTTLQTESDYATSEERFFQSKWFDFAWQPLL